MIFAIRCPFLLVTVFILWAPFCRAGEETIESTKLPKAVTDAVNSRFPSAQLTNATKESVNDRVVYDIELKRDGHKHEMDVQSDGTVLEIEDEIDVKNLPAPVAAAVQAKYSNSIIKEVMEVNKVTGTKETLDHYEVAITTTDKKALEVIASLDGKSVKEEE